MIDNVGNTCNQPAFKATLRVDTAVKDSARLKVITKAFADQTANMKDILSISSKVEECDNRECFYLGKKYGDSVVAFFGDSFDNMMAKLDDNAIVTKLIKITKSLKKVNKRDLHCEMQSADYYRFQAEKARNMRVAERCRQKGSEVMAGRFEALAGIYEKRLNKLNAEQQKVDKATIAAIEKIADGDKDILGMQSLVF